MSCLALIFITYHTMLKSFDENNIAYKEIYKEQMRRQKFHHQNVAIFILSAIQRQN